MVEIERICANPSCSNPGKHLCSGCGEEIYCSRDCQKADWTEHKAACQAATKPESAALLKSFDALSIKQLKNVMIAKASTFEPKKRDKVLKKLENIVEKPGLIKLVKEHVSINEIETLLTTSPAAAKMQEMASSSGNSSSSSKNKKHKSNTIVPPSSFENMSMPSPDQLRQQAAMMRRNPDMVRKAQPAFAHLTDQQIREYADQLEQTANDPNMLKEVEKMAKMSTEDRAILQNVQEGLTGVKPIDDAWIMMIIDALKTRPNVFKTMLKGRGQMIGGVTDEQIESYIDMGSAMNRTVLKVIAYAIWYLSLAAKPISEFYKTVDNYTFGSARYIFLGIFLFFGYYFCLAGYFVFKWIFVRVYAVAMLLYGAVSGNKAQVASELAKKAAQTVANTVEQEFSDVATTTVGKVAAAAAGAVGAAAVNDAIKNGVGAAAASTPKAAAKAEDEFEF